MWNVFSFKRNFKIDGSKNKMSIILNKICKRNLRVTSKVWNVWEKNFIDCLINFGDGLWILQ